jgi:hypothetical protein
VIGRARAWTDANPAVALFAIGLVVAVAVIVAAGWHTTFMRGDWNLLLYRGGSFEGAFLEPSGGNIVAGTAAVYRGLLHLFGLSPAAYRILLAALFAVASVLLFVTLRRRVGDVAAAVGAGLTLLMGAAHQDLLWPLQLGYVVAVACGLGALLAIERRDRKGDALACVLLCVGALTFTAGLAFAVCVATILALRGEDRRRLWIPAVPFALVLVWLVIWGRDATSGPIGSEVLDSPVFLFNGFAAALAALLGLSTPQNTSGVDGIEWGRALLLVGLVAAAWRLRNGGRATPRLWGAIVGAASFWLVAAAYEEPGRLATSSRYTYIGAVFVLLIGAELAAGLRPRRPAVIVMLLAAAVAIASSANFLGQAANRYERKGNLERAGLAAIELTRDSVDPAFALTPQTVHTGWAPVIAGPYLAALDRYGGSPAYAPDELRTAPAYAHVAADRTLAAALGLHLQPASSEALPSACHRVDSDSPTGVPLPSGGALIDPGNKTVVVRLGRFSRSFPVKLGTVEGEPAELAIPADASSRPWLARFDSAVRICPRP